MRLLVPGLVASFFLLAVPPAFAACGDRAGDDEAVAATRSAAGRCDCAAAERHAQYVHCVATVANEAVAARRLRRQCRAAVVRCAVRSTCGRPGAVACCRTSAGGERTCAIRSDATLCTPPPGGGACVSDRPSCCDACASGTCAPTSSTTTTTTSATTTTATLPARRCASDAECDDGNGCSQDRCVDGACQHECLCVGPTGAFTCCPGPAAECGPTWFYTCGDPVCGGHTEHPGVPPCGPGEIQGAPCSPEGATCDPGSPCNQLLQCATEDPTHGGVCPISRRRYKEGVRYLGAEDVQRLHDQLMRFPLATYRYKDASSRTQLGFVIEDVEPSLSVDPGRDMVDLYGYTTMAVAALQSQAREIEALRRELAEIRAVCKPARRR